MSAAFQAEHEASIKSEHQAVDHGLKGVVGVAEAMKKNDLKTIEAIQLREVVAMGVDQVRTVPPEALKQAFTEDLADWNKRAADPKRRDRAKYQKLVARAQPLEALPAKDEKFLLGYAVLKSIDNDGPDTEEAVLAIHKRVHDEREQAAWDAHNLKGRLKQQLTAFVAIASKVNFNAPTVEKSGTTMFVNAADEKQGAIWKACFRAGEAPTAAALKLAKAWLLEL
jgi:ribosomal protein S30